MTALIQPLNAEVEIVDERGRPTLQFMRILQKLSLGTGLTKDAAGNITFASMVANTILANKTAGTANPTACTISDILDFVTTTRGSILFRGVSGWQALAPGTATYLLQTNGAGADPTWVTPPTGGGGATTPTLRATTIIGFNNSTVTAPFPAGTIAGDVVIILTSSGWNVNTPTGWTAEDVSTGSNTNGACFAKVMTSADITTGSVTVTYGGSYWGVITLSTIVGTTMSGIRGFNAVRSSSGASSVIVAPAINFLSTDLILCYISNRGSSTDTMTNTSLLQTSTNTDASGYLGKYTGTLSKIALPSAADLSETATYTTAGTGYYNVVIGLR